MKNELISTALTFGESLGLKKHQQLTKKSDSS